MAEKVKLSWATIRVKVRDIKLLDFNPRKISDREQRKLMQSLEKWDVFESPVLNLDHTAISGNQRVGALLLLGRGEEEIEVKIPNRRLTKDEVKEIALLGNSHNGEWDFDLLKTHFTGLGFDLFDDFNITLPLGDITGGVDMGRTFPAGGESSLQTKPILQVEEDDYEPPEEVETDIMEGDLFEIGGHRLLCGNSTEPSHIEKLMGGNKADMVFADPPYGVSIGAKNTMLNSFLPSGRNSTPIHDDSLSVKDLKASLLKVFTNARNLAVKDKCAIYMTAPQGGELGMMMMMMMEAKLPIRHVLIWVKNAPTFSMGRLDYDYKHEPILFTWVKTHKKVMGGDQKTSVWEYDKPRSSSSHPTMKPVPLVCNAIMNSSEKGDIVLDPYIGSGTTMVAAQMTGRRCYGMEISPKYCQVIISRMFALNIDIKILRNGEPYNLI